MTLLHRFLLYVGFGVMGYGLVRLMHAPEWVAVLMLVFCWAYIGIMDALITIARSLERTAAP